MCECVFCLISFFFFKASLGFWYAVEREQIGRLVRVRASEAEGQISRNKLRIGKEQ